MKKIKPALVQSPRMKLSPLAAAILVASNPAASFAAEEINIVIEEVIVTATKRETNLQDVPHSITALTNFDIERMGITDIDDLIRALPSVYMQATMAGRNQLTMRGISTGSNEYRTDSQVAVYVDEQPMTTNSQQVGVRAIDMQRIESLPGPQGTIFGSSSQTGTLRYITNKPDFAGLSGAIDVGAGTTKGGSESHELSGHINIPLIDDVLSLRAVAYSSHEGGYVDNILGSSLSGNFDNAAIVDKDINENDVDGGRLALLWNMSDNWSTLFSVIGENNDAKGTWESDPYLGDYKITRFFDEYRTDDWFSAAISVQGDLGFANLSLTGTHFERAIAYEFDNNVYSQRKDAAYGGRYFQLYNAGDPAYANYGNFPLYDSEYSSSTLLNDQFQDRETLELRLTSQGDSRLQWMVGGYYESVHDGWYYTTEQPNLVNTRAWAAAQAYAYLYLNNYGYENVQYPLAETETSYAGHMDRTVDQIAVFGELGYDLTDKLSVTLGARWSEFERDEFDIYHWPAGLPVPGGFDSDGGYGDFGKSSDTIYKIGAKYQFDEDKMGYFLFSQGFRLGGRNSARAANTGLIPRDFDPDFLDNYEVGFKTQWLDNRLQINVSAFYMDWKDYHVSTGGIGKWWVRGTINAPGADTSGFEANFLWRANARLSISGSLFSASPEFSDDLLEPGGSGDLRIIDGMPMPGSPENKSWLSVNYEVPNVFGGDLWFYYDIAYQSETWSRISDIRDDYKGGLADSWTFSSFSAGLYLNNGVDITFKVRNLFDEQGWNYAYTGYDDYGTEFFGGDPRFKSARALDVPRTMSLSFRKAF